MAGESLESKKVFFFFLLFAFWRILIGFLFRFGFGSFVFSFPLSLSCFFALDFCFSAEALVLRSGVLTRKLMYIDGIFSYLFLSDRAVLFFLYFFFLGYVTMQILDIPDIPTFAI